jgi:predicted transposase/invertase (TIGR01784 family)
VDVKCKDNFKRQFIIEMQMDWNEVFTNRIVFNAGKAYVKQLERSEAYHLLHPVYTLAILNENFDHKTEHFYHHYQIVNRANTDEIIPGLEFVLLELEKFHPATVAERKLMILWLRFLKEVNEGMTELPPELAANEQIRQAAELCRESAFTPEELAVYEKYWDIIRTEVAVRESSIQKGKAEGRAEGLAEGLAEGEAKGRTEQQENMVVNSRRAGLQIETISTITELTPEKVNEILKRHGLV